VTLRNILTNYRKSILLALLFVAPCIAIVHPLLYLPTIHYQLSMDNW